MLQPQSQEAAETNKNHACTSCTICRMAVVRQEVCRLSMKVEYRTAMFKILDTEWLAASSMKERHH